MTVAEMVAELARSIGDVDPATGRPAYRRYTESAYLEIISSLEDQLLTELPIDCLFPLVVHVRHSYTDTQNWMDLLTLNPEFRRLCVDGIATDGVPAEELTAERRSMVQPSSTFHSPYSIHAWFLRGDNRLEVWPIAKTTTDTQQKHWVDFDYVRATNEMVVSSPTGSEVTTSELPEKCHRLLCDGSKANLYLIDGWLQEAERTAGKFDADLKALKGERTKAYVGGSLP